MNIRFYERILCFSTLAKLALPKQVAASCKCQHSLALLCFSMAYNRPLRSAVQALLYIRRRTPCACGNAVERLVSTLENIERMADRMNRAPYLYITGGDPILHSRFWDLLELVHSHGIPFTLMGNPTFKTTNPHTKTRKTDAIHKIFRNSFAHIEKLL